MDETLRKSLNFVGAAVLAAPVFAGEPLVIRGTETGRVIAEHQNGQRVWEIRLPEERRLSIEATANGTLLIDGRTVVDRKGQVLEQIPGRSEVHRGPSLEGNAPMDGTLVWDEPVNLGFEGPFPKEAPVFDSAGNVWILASLGETLSATRSEGHTNNWLPYEPIVVLDEDENFGDGAATIDHEDRITVVYRVVGGGSRLDVVRYTPQSGWGAPQTIYGTGDFFQNVDAAVDAEGNVLVGFDGESLTAFYTITYDAAAETWAPAERLSWEGAGDVAAGTLVQNESGSALYAVFWVNEEPFLGIHATRFESGTRSWGPIQRLPGSRRHVLAGTDAVGASAAAAADAMGTLTVLSYTSRQLDPTTTLWRLWGHRVGPGGAASLPTLLMEHLDDPASLLSFTDTEANARGDVISVFPRASIGGGFGERVAVRYDGMAQAWDPAQSIYRSDSLGSTVTRVAFLANGAAVATFQDNNEDPFRLSSRLFDGQRWSAEKGAISPELAGVVGHETATDGGDVVIWLDDSGADPGLYTSWMRSKLPAE